MEIKEKLISQNKQEKEAINYLVELIIKKCETDNQLKDLILNKDEKNIDNCWNFIKHAIRQKAKNGSYGATDDEVLGLAIHYYTEDEIEIPKEEIQAQTTIKPVKEKVKSIKQEIKEKVKTIKKPKKQDENQMSLLDFGIEL